MRILARASGHGGLWPPLLSDKHRLFGIVSNQIADRDTKEEGPASSEDETEPVGIRRGV